MDAYQRRLEGKRSWRRNGVLHREDGPAHRHHLGDFWYYNGKLHREDGPAMKSAVGEKHWCK